MVITPDEIVLIVSRKRISKMATLDSNNITDRNSDFSEFWLFHANQEINLTNEI